MDAKTIRKKFLDFFKDKGHTIIPSAPMVVKDDPTLMFTNAGMNQFKDIFLDLIPVKYKRVADSQKCLRVSGKHNDLEEVGVDTYHHTMFEMLGNWSFGDYFKKEAISWAWELLVDVYKLPPNRLYATIFEGSNESPRDVESFEFWKEKLPAERILNGSPKDNFWEMGEIGPCGPCSEIHIDLRDEDDRIKVPGRNLVNKDHPLVIEIWNLVFIQFNRCSNGSLEKLPQTHVDTGMGFERLCMALQGKTSNYDTDIFQPIIKRIEKITGKPYGEDKSIDIAMRVIADHVRTISFSIAEAQLPSNNKAGYVIRRILRRAIRYAYTFLGMNKPFIYRLVSGVEETLGEHFSEIKSQKKLIEEVIFEEENAFLRTLEHGLKLMEQIVERNKKQSQKVIEGKEVFKLYDTYGFPVDLTKLIAKEQGLSIDMSGFKKALEQQRAKSRTATVATQEWSFVKENEMQEFIGYDTLESTVKIVKYRIAGDKKQKNYHLVFNHTPFYGESGGQVGDIGKLEDRFGEVIYVLDTIKEHNEIIHIVKELPKHIDADFRASVDENKRNAIKKHHSATHLLHYALRRVLGTHVEQKGSLVNAEHLSFDFSHFQKLTLEELKEVEYIVNDLIQEAIPLQEERTLPIESAKKMGAMALFGEKYGDIVRVIKFGESVELCGGTHVKSTGELGIFKIVTENSIASGIRRIEAVAGKSALDYINNYISLVKELEHEFKVPIDKVMRSVDILQKQNKELNTLVDSFKQKELSNLKENLIQEAEVRENITFITTRISVDNAEQMRQLAYLLKSDLERFVFVGGTSFGEKAHLSIMFSQNLVNEFDLHAGNLIKEVAKEIQGGGGGQDFFASAGGRNISGIDVAIAKAKEQIKKDLKINS